MGHGETETVKFCGCRRGVGAVDQAVGGVVVVVRRCEKASLPSPFHTTQSLSCSCAAVLSVRCAKIFPSGSGRHHFTEPGTRLRTASTDFQHCRRHSCGLRTVSGEVDGGFNT